MSMKQMCMNSSEDPAKALLCVLSQQHMTSSWKLETAHFYADGSSQRVVPKILVTRNDAPLLPVHTEYE